MWWFEKQCWCMPVVAHLPALQLCYGSHRCTRMRAQATHAIWLVGDLPLMLFTTYLCFRQNLQRHLVHMYILRGPARQVSGFPVYSSYRTHRAHTYVSGWHAGLCTLHTLTSRAGTRRLNTYRVWALFELPIVLLPTWQLQQTFKSCTWRHEQPVCMSQLGCSKGLTSC